MRSWKTKIISLLVVYFAGFATAIYCQAPVPGDQLTPPSHKSFVQSAFKSDELATSFNTTMHRCLDIGKNTALRAGQFLRKQYNEKIAEKDS